MIDLNDNKIIKFFNSRKDLFAAALRYCIFNFAVFCLIGLYYKSQTYLSVTSFKGELYTFIMFLGLPGCAALIIGALCALAAIINKSTMRAVGILISTASITFMLIDAVVFTQYKFHIDITMLALFFSAAGTELISFSWSMFLMAAAAFVIIIALACAMMFAAEKFNKKILNKIAALTAALIVVGILFFHGWHAAAAFAGDTEILERNQIFPLNIGLTAKRLLFKMGFRPGERVNLNVKNGVFLYPLKPLKFADKSEKYNVIFILVDSLRGDMVNAEIMPYLYKFSKNAANFKNHYSNGNCTRSGVFALFSGLPGTYWQSSLEAGHGSVLLDSLIERGYQTGVFFSATLINPEFDSTVFSRVKNMTLKRNGNTKIDRDREALNDFKKFIQQRDKSKPFAGVLMFDSLHGYEYPENFNRKFASAPSSMNYLLLKKDDKGQQQRIFKLFCTAAAFSDTQLEETLEFLKKEVDLKNTIIVIASDHGNECNEAGNNIWGHNSRFSKYQLHVPLIITGGPFSKEEYTHRTYHTDVVPTLMPLLGCLNPPEDYSVGKSLFDKSKRDVMVVSSYLNRGLLYDDIVFEMTKSGVVRNYTVDEKNIKNPPPKEILQKYFEMISRFSR